MVTQNWQNTKSFLQSAEWEMFQRRLARKTWRAEGKLVIRHDLPLGAGYLYSPKPIFDSEDQLKDFLEDAEKIAKKEGDIFLKVEPAENFQFSIFNFQFKKARALQPQKTLVIDLSKSDKELLHDMHPKTRYNIRLAAKHGVVMKKGNKDDLEKFLAMLKDTARRDGFHTHEKDHYKRLLEIRTDAFWNDLFFAEHQGNILAAALVNFYRPSMIATYLHGVSSRQHKEMMASNLLHWEIMREARVLGFGFYDFWGIDDKRWPGVTRFKLGFGGRTVGFPPAKDIIYRPVLYSLYSAFRFLKHKM